MRPGAIAKLDPSGLAEMRRVIADLPGTSRAGKLVEGHVPVDVEEVR